jgi:hypothetical protein
MATESPGYDPTMVLMAVKIGAVEFPEGETGAPYHHCYVARDIMAVLDQHQPKSISRIIPGFNPDNYKEYVGVPPLDRFLRVAFGQEVDVPSLVRALEEADTVLFAEPAYRAKGEGVNKSSERVQPFGSDASAVMSGFRKQGRTGQKDLQFAPNDTVYAESTEHPFQWNLHGPQLLGNDPGYGIDCPKAWTYTSGKPDVKIGVVEDGFWWNHNDIEVAGGVRIEGEYDFLFGWIYYPVPPNLQDYNEHATKCAGIIGAKTNNSIGIAGIAGGDGDTPGCNLFDIAMDRTLGHGEAPELHATALFAAVEDLGCHVLSYSCGITSGYSEVFRGTVRFANAVGTSLVASNRYYFNLDSYYPAWFDHHWVTVAGAYNKQGDSSFPANVDSFVDILGPGEDVPTLSIPGCQNTDHAVYQDQVLDLFCATSCASPHVAASIGLLRSYLGNGWLPYDYECILKLSSVDPDSADCNPQTWTEGWGHGRLNVGNAISNVAENSIYTFAAVPAVVPSSADTLQLTVMTGAREGQHGAIRYRLTADIVFDSSFDETPLAWGNHGCFPFMNWGVSDATVNYGEPYSKVVDSSVTDAGCTVESYVYKLWNNLQQDYTDWFPADPVTIQLVVNVLGNAEENRTGPQKAAPVAPLLSMNVFPNPFNPQTEIQLVSGFDEPVQVEIFDVRGRLVWRVQSELSNQWTRFLTWDGYDFSGRSLPAGIYLVRASTRTESLTRKINLVK